MIQVAALLRRQEFRPAGGVQVWLERAKGVAGIREEAWFRDYQGWIVSGIPDELISPMLTACLCSELKKIDVSK